MNARVPVLLILLLSASVSTEEVLAGRDSSPVHRVRSLPEVEERRVAVGNWSSIVEELDFFSTRHLVSNWIDGKYPVGEECAKDIRRYIQGLKGKELWAQKVDDASGRYTNGFFWGNSYFTGSATECEYIGRDYAKRTFSPLEEETRKIITAPVQTDVSLNYGPDNAPYPLGFFMLAMSLNSTVTSNTRLIHLGLCLPFSCTAADVTVIAKLGAGDAIAKHSTIIKIRDQHNSYNMYADPVFWILFGVTAAIVVLMVIGTGYDLYLTRKVSRRKKMIYDLESHSKLEPLANGNHKMIDDKLRPGVPGAMMINDSVPVNNNNESEGTIRPPSPKIPKLSILEEVLLSFSVRVNMLTICDSTVGRDTISTVHGLRTLSMIWVILGHSCIMTFRYSDNMEYRKVVEKNLLFQVISNGPFSVDTFFFMGGLLVSFLFFRTNAKGDLNKLTQGTRGIVAGTLKFIGLMAYRFCRLTAPYMFVLGVVEVTMKWFHANAVFEPPAADHFNCPNYWWRNVLYINTLFPVDEMCMLWSWYVADDTQFYTVGAVILVLATNHFKIAASALITLLVSSWVTTGYIALINNHRPSTDDPLALFDKIYDKPWTRLGPYLIGMSVGYILFKTDCKIKMSKTTVAIGWILSCICFLSLIFGLYEMELSPVMSAAYSSLSHSAWALGLSWIVIACSTGYGGYVNKLLSAPILYPFSRVTYCAYLVHPILIRVTAMNLDAPIHLGIISAILIFLGLVCLSYFLSFIISITFEAPIVSMLKILSPKKKNRIQ